MPRSESLPTAGGRSAGDGAGAQVHVNGIDRWPLVELSRGEVVRAARAALASHPGPHEGELSISFVDDAEIAELNMRWLDRAGPTDVIAFSLGSPESVLGDVYVSVDTATANAAELGIAAEEELLRLVIHGTLHVLGHDHPEGAGRESSDMFRLQEELLRGLRDG
jgi:probable rRNA maturation factor